MMDMDMNMNMDMAMGMDDEERRMESIIRKAAVVAAKEALKIKMLEYKMDFGTVITKVKMSLN